MFRRTLTCSIGTLAVFCALPAVSSAQKRAPTAPDAKWKVRKAPEITGFSPKQGAPGSTVTINGKHFEKGIQARFNGRTLRVISTTATAIKVKLPKDAVTDRFVVLKSGFKAASADTAFNVVRKPLIASFTPARGDVGITVTVHGKHFLPSDKLMLGKKAMVVSSSRPTAIMAKVPPGATSGRISLRRGKKTAATSKRAFQVALPPPVITSFSPPRGSPGTVVRLAGRHFDSRDRVTLAGKKLRIRARTATTIDVVIGNNATGVFNVRGSGGRSGSSTGSFFVVRPAKVTGFQPRFGPPGTRVRVFGKHFLAGDAVYLGDRALTVRTLAPKLIVAEVPAGVTTGRLSVRRGAKRYKARGKFKVQYPPTIAQLVPSGGPAGTTIRIEGTNFTKTGTVLLAGKRLKVVKKKLPEKLWVKLPKDARTGRLVVVTSAGTAQSKKNFAVVHYARPRTFGPKNASYGATVRLQGTRFHKGVRVFLGKQELTVTRVLPTQVWVKVPEGAKSGRLSIESYGKRFGLKEKLVVVPPAPLLAFTVTPQRARRGSEVTLDLQPPTLGVAVYFNGRPLPVRVLGAGKQVVVTVPSDAKTAYIEVEYKGRRYKSPKKLRVR